MKMIPFDSTMRYVLSFQRQFLLHAQLTENQRSFECEDIKQKKFSCSYRALTVWSLACAATLALMSALKNSSKEPTEHTR